MRFSDELRKQHPALASQLDELESFLAQYDARFKRRLTSQVSRPRRLLGHRCAQLLLSSLSRARFLAATVIHCANGGLVAGIYLAARAHWEMTGLVSHLLITLRKFYAGQITEAVLDSTMAKLSLGRRWEIPSIVQEDITAINAITLLGSAGKLLDLQDAEDLVKSCYDFLSEHCHPNLFSRLTGVTFSEDLRVVDYDPGFVMNESDLGSGLSRGVFSHFLFFLAYDECFRLLNEHEEMPTLEE